MAAKLKLELLSGLRQQRNQPSRSASGFTMIELMVVIFIFSLIAAVAIPTLLRARNRSEAGSVVGELTGIAKECAMAVPADGVVCLGVTAGPSVSGVYITVSPAGRMSCSFV
jgi:prepilin-type N-terminal cleavage/methylation domain-containing protein